MARDEAIPTGDMLLHARAEWPCSMCRPQCSVEGRGSFLCVSCAAELVAASFARLACSPELAQGSPTALACLQPGSAPVSGWDLLRLALLDAEDQ